MVTTRTWLAIVGAPILGAGVYACLTLASLAQATIVEKPTPLGLIVSGAVVGLIFELVILVPLLLALRRWWRLDAVRFAILGCLAWFAVCFLVMLPLGGGVNSASATAVLMFLPGATLVLAFWFLGANRNAA